MKKFKFKTDNKLPAYGETDFDKKVVKINKKRHKSKRFKRISKKPDGDEHLGKTIYHELTHVRHPKMKEKTVRKKEKNWDRLSDKEKQRVYSKLK